LLKIINWNILIGIKHLNIYDPFSVISGKENWQIFYNAIRQVYNKSYSILFICENGCYDCRRAEELEIKNVKKENYTLVISLITFQSANQDLIKNTCMNYKDNIVVPNELEYLIEDKYSGIEEINTSINTYTYEKFFTKKNSMYLPELIIFFSDEELCLYGYPYTLLENTEIINAGLLKSLDVIKYVQIFERYSKVDKRFGK
jgi:hypothetical protein